jgi:hypothetical protein
VELAPIVLFVYKRPEHATQLLRSLKSNKEAAHSKLFVFSEAPKSPKEAELVNETRKIIRSESWCKDVVLIERDEHLGCRKNIEDGITQIIGEYGKAIIVEEDLILGRHFLSFMNQGLERYAEEERVMHLSGYMWPVEQTNIPESFFIKFVGIWGWATWKRAWDKLERDHRKLEEALRERQLIREFCLNDGYKPLFSWLKDLDRKDTWDVIWYASVFLNDGLSLQSGRTLTANTGNDGSGLHSLASNMFDVEAGDFLPRSFPDRIEQDEVMAKAVSDWFRKNRSYTKRIAERFRTLTNLVKS